MGRGSDRVRRDDGDQASHVEARPSRWGCDLGKLRGPPWGRGARFPYRGMGGETLSARTLSTVSKRLDGVKGFSRTVRTPRAVNSSPRSLSARPLLATTLTPGSMARSWRAMPAPRRAPFSITCRTSRSCSSGRRFFRQPEKQPRLDGSRHERSRLRVPEPFRFLVSRLVPRHLLPFVGGVPVVGDLPPVPLGPVAVLASGLRVRRRVLLGDGGLVGVSEAGDWSRLPGRTDLAVLHSQDRNLLSNELAWRIVDRETGVAHHHGESPTVLKTMGCLPVADSP